MANQLKTFEWALSVQEGAQVHVWDYHFRLSSTSDLFCGVPGKDTCNDINLLRCPIFRNGYIPRQVVKNIQLSPLAGANKYHQEV